MFHQNWKILQTQYLIKTRLFCQLHNLKLLISSLVKLFLHQDCKLSICFCKESKLHIALEAALSLNLKKVFAMSKYSVWSKLKFWLLLKKIQSQCPCSKCKNLEKCIFFEIYLKVDQIRYFLVFKSHFFCLTLHLFSVNFLLSIESSFLLPFVLPKTM